MASPTDHGEICGDTGAEYLGAVDVGKPSIFTGTGIAPLQSLPPSSVPAWILLSSPSGRTCKRQCFPPAVLRGLRGAEAVPQGPVLSWGSGTRAGTSQGQPEEPGAAASPQGPCGNRGFTHGSSGAGAGLVGGNPRSFHQWLRERGGSKSRAGWKCTTDWIDFDKPTLFSSPFFPLLFLPSSSSSSLRAAHLPLCASYPHSPL